MIRHSTFDIRHLRPNNQSGFTLLELIIVMLLSGMILGLVSVYLFSFSTNARLQATVREFSGEIINGKYHLVFEPNWGGENTIFQLSNQKKMIQISLDPLMGAVISR